VINVTERSAFADYAFKVERGAAGEFYLSVPRLPGVNAEGDTIQEALENLECAFEDWVEDVTANGGDVPAPVEDAKFSGYSSVRMSPALHAELAGLAVDQGLSLNAFIVSSLSAAAGSAHAVDRSTREFEALGRQMRAIETQMADLRSEVTIVASTVSGYALAPTVRVNFRKTGWDSLATLACPDEVSAGYMRTGCTPVSYVHRMEVKADA